MILKAVAGPDVAPYQLKGTLEFAVDRRLRSAGSDEPARVVHRLDKGTSGGGLPAPRMMLHCRRMSFDAADGRRVEATAPADAAFRDGCRRFGLFLDAT